MKKIISKLCFLIVLISLVFGINIGTPAAVKKNTKYCDFTLNRTNVNKKARKVKLGKIKLTVKKSGYVRFTAPSRATYTFAWTGPKTGKRVKITPMFVLNYKTLSCLGYYCNYDIYGKSRNVSVCEGYLDCTKYKDLYFYGEIKANKYRIILDKGEEIYFFMKISPKKNADIGLKITRKAVNNVIKPAQGKTIANFEKLKQAMAKSASNLNGNPVREKTWYFNNKPFTERIIYKKQTDQIVFEWDNVYEQDSESYKIQMIYDKSTITKGKTNIHVLKYSGKSIEYDAVATVDIYSMVDETDIRFTVRKNLKNLSITDINFDALFEFDACFNPADWMPPRIIYRGLLSDMGLSFRALGFVSFHFS